MSQGTVNRRGTAVLTPEEESRLAWEIAFQGVHDEYQHGFPLTEMEIFAKDWKHEPVGPEEFLFSDKYAGLYGSGLYERWKEELLFVLNPANHIHEWILTGSIGAGKSTAAALAMTYKLYRIGCMRDPCDTFGLMADSSIVFGLYSLFKYKSQDDNYALLKTMIDGIPFFRGCYPRPKHENPSAADTLEFNNRVSVIAGSTELHALGLNLLCLLMDEANFMKEQQKSGSRSSVSQVISQAQDLYNASKRRLESRFHFRGSTPGLMVLISSRNAESSWLERHMAEVLDLPGVHVSDFPLWEVKPAQNYCGKRFFVEVGDAIRASRIIDGPLDAREGARVVSPPIEHLSEFKTDIEGALRDIAGVANVAVSSLIKDKDSLQASVDPKLYHPFTKQQFPISHLDDIEIKTYFEATKVVRVVKSFPKPLLNPHAPRIVHVDLAETGDAAGIAMGHLADTHLPRPRVLMDFCLRLLAPEAGQIDFTKIVDFILFLRNSCGYQIKSASFDRFQSTHSRQILTKLGFEAPYFSVDRNDEAYIVLRSTIQEGRFSVYDYTPLFEELSRLLHDTVRKKVDHPQGGSKDVSDAVAGVVAQLMVGLGDGGIGGGTDPLNAPEPVKSLQERLEEAGALATAVSTSRGRVV